MTNLNEHYKGLIRMYLSANFNSIFKTKLIEIQENQTLIKSEIVEEFYHAGGAAHGFSYFRLLDDSAYFAAASLESEYFILTKEFNIKFIRPLLAGDVHATGTAELKDNLILANSRLIQNEKIVAEGNGIFVRSNKLLSKIPAYLTYPN